MPSETTSPNVRPPLFILDVDGVLIDPGESFTQAVAQALRELAPGVVWSDEHFMAFKRAGGFNNDFRLTAGALALAERGEMDRLWASEGIGFPDLEDRMEELEPLCKQVVQRHYAHTRFMERPTVTLQDLTETGMDLAIFTGRPPEELLLAWEVLGFQLPAICDSAPHLRKPSPEGLLQLADTFSARKIIFAGDTLDDAASLKAARRACPERTWVFAALGVDRERIAHPGDLQAESLPKLLAVLRTTVTSGGF